MYKYFVSVLTFIVSRTGHASGVMMDSDECCPTFEPQRWDEKTLHWDERLFIMESVPTLFHMPLPSSIGKKITRMWEMAMQSQACPAIEDALILFRDPSAFRSEIYCTVTKEVPGADNVTMSGTYVSKVFDGPYNAIPRFMKEMESYLSGMGKVAEDYLVHYAYCPKCAKERGHNHLILFAKV